MTNPWSIPRDVYAALDAFQTLRENGWSDAQLYALDTHEVIAIAAIYAEREETPAQHLVVARSNNAQLATPPVPHMRLIASKRRRWRAAWRGPDVWRNER